MHERADYDSFSDFGPEESGELVGERPQFNSEGHPTSRPALAYGRSGGLSKGVFSTSFDPLPSTSSSPSVFTAVTW